MRSLIFILLTTSVLIGCNQDVDKYEFAGYDRVRHEYRIFDKKSGILYEIGESEKHPGTYDMRMIGPAGVFTRMVSKTKSFCMYPTLIYSGLLKDCWE